jgi:hypothetical protein
MPPAPLALRRQYPGGPPGLQLKIGASANERAPGRPSYADSLIEVSRAYRHGGAERLTPVVRELTGQDPVSLEEFVRDHVSVFQ